MSEVIVQTQKRVTNGQFLAEVKTFLIVWLGQVVSLLGSSMTGFALGVWIYQETGSATGFALTLLFNMLPRAVFAPVAGVIADRYNRSLVMIVADFGAGVTTVLTALLFLSGQLDVWHIYLFTALNSSFGALQGPAFGASVTQLVPKAHFGRANGLMELGQGVSQILAPVLAGLLIVGAGLWSVLMVDMATFFFAVLTLLLVRFPAYSPEAETADVAQKETWRQQIWQGWSYLWTRPGLLGLVLVFTAVNFFIGIAEAVLTPMILSFATPEQLGMVMTIGGVGLLMGSVLMSIWGGGKRKVPVVFGAYALLAVGVFLAGLSPSVWLIATALFLVFFLLPTVLGGKQAILQAKVAAEVQGRVFALSGMFFTLSFALAYLIGGPLADRVFEPLMAADGLLAGTVGQIISVGPGRGMGLIFVVMGLLAMVTAVSAFAYPRIRNLETELPDMVS
jgi:MFS family permease